MEKTLTKKSRIITEKIIYIAITVVFAVALPQLIHIIGRLTGTNTALGQILLPMHIPVLILGFCAGPWAGLAAGILAPVASHLLTAMPASALLPYIAAETAAYGLFAGLLKNVKLHPIAKIVSVQILGRLVRILAALLLSAVMSNNTIAFSAAIAGMLSCIPGIILQIILIPYIVRIIERSR